MSTTYNGWTNYATWRVNLEIFDGMSAVDLGSMSPSELKDLCRDMAEEIIEQTTSEGLGRDYAMSFLSDVDWWAIADHLIGADEQEAA
jgi:hypothetical protein